MSKPRKARPQTAAPNSVNWPLIGGIIGVGALGLIALLLVNVFQSPTAAQPTPVLQEGVNDLVAYCNNNPDRCLSYGPQDAPVRMVEISDYSCLYCKLFNETSGPILHQTYVETGQMRYIILPFALRSATAPSAEAVMCAAEQGLDKALHFHEKLFALQGNSAAHTLDGFLSVARQTDVDPTALQTCFEAGTYRDTISLNRQAASQIGIEGTPSFFINGRFFQGNQPLEVFQQYITSLLQS